MGYRHHLDEITENASQTVDDVVDGVSRATNQMNHDRRALQRELTARAEKLRHEARIAARKVRGDARDTHAAVSRAARHFNSDLTDLTRDRPIGMLLAAATFGLAIGWLTSR